MRILRTLVAIPVLLVLSTPLIVSVQADQCESCHGGSNPSAGYTFVKPTISFNAPSAIKPNSTMDIALSVQHYGTYDLKNIIATLDLSKAMGVTLVTPNTEKRSLADMDTKAQTHGLTWSASSGTAIGQVEVSVNVSYTVHFPHNSGGSKDTSTYAQTLSQGIQIISLPFDISPGSFLTNQGQPQSFTVNITAQANLYNLALVPGLSIRNFTNVNPATIGALAKGQSKVVTVSMTPDKPLEHGLLVVIWSLDKAGTNMSKLSLNVVVLGVVVNQGTTTSTQDNSRLAARVLGFTGLILLILLMPTGGPLESIKKVMNKAMGSAKRRVDLHCAVSYLLLSIGLLHSSLLMYGHYKNAMWNGVFLVATTDYISIDLGSIAMLLMVFISLLGIFQKRLCKTIGRKAWCWVHGILSYSALAIIIVHLLWIGTTAAPIRALLLH